VLGVANIWNVLSNMPLLFVGIFGIWIVRHRSLPKEQTSSMMIFFGAVALTGLGSSWYHLAPNNESLIFDRLPIACALVVLYCSWLGRWQSSDLLAPRFLVLALLLAVASVLWWAYSESVGAGDLRAYVLLQFGALVSAPILIETSHKRSAARYAVYPVLMMYFLAKLCEVFDAEILHWTGLSAGHAIKHLFAALAVLWVALDVWGVKYSHEK